MNTSQDFEDEYHIMVFTSVAQSINIILALPLNCYVIWLILAGTKRTLDTDIFSLNLALSEVFISLTSVWYFVCYGTKFHLCYHVVFFFDGLLFTSRPLFQCCICIECYVGVVHPVFFLKCKQLRHRMAFCCIVWLIVLSSCVYSLFTFTQFLYHYWFFVQNLLVLSVILFCCLTVLKALKHPGPGEKNTEKKASNKAKRKAFKIIFFIMIYMIMNFFLFVGPIPLQNCLTDGEYIEVLFFGVGLALAIGFIQPIFYLHRSGKCSCLKNFKLSSVAFPLDICAKLFPKLTKC